MTNKERTELLREFLCGCAKRGSFSLIIYDAHSGRTCAARTAASPKLFFGFDKKKNGNAATKEEGKRGLCVSTDEKSLEKCGFIHYRRVDSFTVDNTLSRWSSHSFGRRLHRSKTAQPRLSGDLMNSAIKGRKDYKSANTKSNSVVQTTSGSKQGVESNGPYTPDSGIKNDFMKAMRYAPTGSKADLRERMERWSRGFGRY